MTDYWFKLGDFKTREDLSNSYAFKCIQSQYNTYNTAITIWKSYLGNTYYAFLNQMSEEHTIVFDYYDPEDLPLIIDDQDVRVRRPERFLVRPVARHVLLEARLEVSDRSVGNDGLRDGHGKD